MKSSFPTSSNAWEQKLNLKQTLSDQDLKHTINFSKVKKLMNLIIKKCKDGSKKHKRLLMIYRKIKIMLSRSMKKQAKSK